MSTDSLMQKESKSIPRLEPGDRLTRDEFHRRYLAMPEGTKAELIEGIVYMLSSVRFKHHGEPHLNLITWLGVYAASTPSVSGGDNTSMLLDLDNEPQPDCMLFIRPEAGGQVRIDPDDYIVGAPEFVAEVSASSLAVDRGPKLRTFLRHGVKEYLIWRVEDRKFEWNILRGGSYEHLVPDPDGVLRSEAFPGLWLDTVAMLKGDLATVLKTLQHGLASPEHRQFINP